MLIFTGHVELSDGKSSKYVHTGRATSCLPTCVIQSSLMCQLTLIDKNRISMDAPLQKIMHLKFESYR